MTAAEPDVAQKTEAPSRLSHRERVKLSQDLAASLAHRVRNPIFALVSATQFLRHRVTDDPQIERHIGRILREADRLTAIAGELLEYGRPALIHLAPADPDEVWTSVIERQRGDLEAKAILVHHEPASPRVTCNIDPDQLGQAFSNVLTNALEAAPEGSDVTLVSSVDVDGTWSCSVHNDGPPVQADILPHAFEPLVSSKPGRSGTGLSVADRILCDHSGSIALRSADDSGTTLTFKLPALHG